MAFCRRQGDRHQCNQLSIVVEDLWGDTKHVPTPEEQARQVIDAQLESAGWVIQDMGAFNRNASLGVAVREFQLPSGACDYLLFIDGKAAGVINPKSI